MNTMYMLLLLLNYVVLRALWKIDVHLISILVNKSIYYIIIIIIIITRALYSVVITWQSNTPIS